MARDADGNWPAKFGRCATFEMMEKSEIEECAKWCKHPQGEIRDSLNRPSMRRLHDWFAHGFRS